MFDIETDGFLDVCTVVHSLCMMDVDTEETLSCTDNCEHYASVEHGLKLLMEADEVIGHNIITFDLPALRKIYPWFKLKDDCKVTDTLILTRLKWPEIDKKDWAVWRRDSSKMPVKYIGRHSMEAWGFRLGCHKGDYSQERKRLYTEEHGERPKTKCKGRDEWDAGLSQFTWGIWNQAMQDYCDQDIQTNFAIYLHIMRNGGYCEFASWIEHRFAQIIQMQVEHGFPFDEQSAHALYAVLAARRQEIRDQLAEAFPPWIEETVFIPKRDNKTRGYKKGVPFTKRKTVHFKPSSRDHIAKCLTDKYGWKPSAFTDTGKPKIDEEVLSALPYPEAPLLAEHFLLDKRCGQISEGREGWLKACKNGRIYGGVMTVGAVTRRCTHSKPNVAQVPKVGSPYGEECRSLFTVLDGWLQLGADASGLELRCLAHYMAKYDGGAYIEAVVYGKEADGTDVHSVNAKALGFDPQKIYTINGKQAKGRDIAKTFIYAFLYGAGGYKVGTIVGVDKSEIQDIIVSASQGEIERAKRELKYLKIRVTRTNAAISIKGNRIKAQFLKKVPAISKLQSALKEALKDRAINAIDGGRLTIRHAHAALNTLLQSAGSIAVKLATVLLYDELSSRGYKWGEDWAMVAHIHDEFQLMIRPELADEIGQVAVESFEKAGEMLGFKCPLTGAFKVGKNWKETH
jgi:hypothetical protein